MRKILLFSFVFIIITFVSSNAKAYWMIGPGAESCGYMIEESKNEAYKNMIGFWLQGYVSALNQKNNSFKFAEFNSIYFETLRICKEKPLLKIYIAASEMYENLEIEYP